MVDIIEVIKGHKISVSVIVALFVIVLWVLVSPLFIDNVVDEALPSGQMEMLISGEFKDADSLHMASGQAKILESGGASVLRFEDFKVTNGPDLYVYLSSEPTVNKDSINLGRLKGNIGNQNYEISNDQSIDDYKYVVIWCRAFSVLFGTAQIS